MGEKNKLTRKVFKIGGSVAMTLPKSWVSWLENVVKLTGTEVNIEDLEFEVIVDRILVIKPPEFVLKADEEIRRAAKQAVSNSTVQ